METNKNLTPFIFMLAIPLVIALFNIPILETLWEYGFDDGTYSHGFLIPFIYIYLCYELYQNGELEMRDKFSLPVTLFFAISCYAFFVSSAAQISLAYWFTNIVLIISSTLMLFRSHWKIVFPAAYFVFMYPLWGPMVNILQQISVHSVSFLMSFTNIPTYVENQFVTIPAGVFEIAGGCSGLRYLITALAISSLYIFLYIKKTKHILLFLAFAIGGALITNWIRITIIILIGHHTDMTSEIIHDHNIFGWYLFIPYMFLLFYFGGKLVIDEKEHPRKKTSKYKAIFKKNMIIAIIGILLTSTTLMAIDTSQSSEDVKNRLQTNDLYPIISGHSQETILEKTYNDSIFLTISYDFDGKKLDGKPTSINNKKINESWHITREESDHNWSYAYAKNKEKNALIAMNYAISGKIQTARNKFKLLRIKEALSGKRHTQLNWIGIICESDCTKERSIIETNKLL